MCINFNKGACETPCCHGRLHKCSKCGGPHPVTQCTLRGAAPAPEGSKGQPPPPPPRTKGKGGGPKGKR